MWYDKYHGIPRRGTPLETIFVMVRIGRQRAELLGTRALIQSLVGLHESRKTSDPAVAAFQAYCDEMIPFMERATNSEEETARERLKELTSHKAARIDLIPHYKQQAEHARKKAALKRFKLQRTRLPGTI